MLLLVLKGIEATCIVVVMGTTTHKLTFLVQATKPWWCLANKAIVILYVGFFTNTINDGAKPKAH